MDFTFEPELNFTNSGLILNSTQAMAIFAPFDENTINEVTLLSPMNMYQFYYDYLFVHDNEALSKKFGISI